jgi:hypothetical protein
MITKNALDTSKAPPRMAARAPMLQLSEGEHMKLNSTLIERTIAQFQAVALPDTHAAHEKLEAIFGDHTFLLNDNGLHIVEPVMDSGGTEVGQVMKIADWQGAGQTRLAPHQPEPTDIVIKLAA